MSYNITHWKTLEIKDLYIHYDDIKQLEDIKLEAEDVNGNHTVFAEGGVSECFVLEGVIEDRYIVKVNIIETSGEWSGRTFEQILDMLSRSRGTLQARVTWEDGKEVERITVIDGVVKREDLE